MQMFRSINNIIATIANVRLAVVAISLSTLVTLVLGVTGWEDMLRSVPFLCCYVWMCLILLLVVVRRIMMMASGGRWRRYWLHDTAFLLNHLGLLVALGFGTVSSMSIERLHLTAKIGSPEWRATDAASRQMPPPVIELPLAIELHNFTIEEYPPKYAIVDNSTGKVVDDSPWAIRQDSILEYAAMVYGARDSLGNQDTGRDVEWHSMGACTAAHVTATNASTGASGSGWVTCGSFMFPYKALRLDDSHSVVMPDREPKRYASEVTVYTKSGKSIDATIEVNRPLEVEGWKIYQLSYDERLGRWSDTSVFELVSDPWLEWVYVGIYMLLAGALLNFLTTRKR